MVTRVFVDDEDWGVVVEREDYLALTADQLREAIEGDGSHEVIRLPHGGYDIIHDSYGDRIELNYHSSVEVTAPLEATVLAIVKDLKCNLKCETADSVFTHDGVEYLLSYAEERVDVEPWDADSDTNSQPTHPATGRAR